MRLHLNLYADSSLNSITRVVQVDKDSDTEIIGEIIADMIDSINEYEKEKDLIASDKLHIKTEDSWDIAKKAEENYDEIENEAKRQVYNDKAND